MLELQSLTEKVIGAAIEVHKELGAGLLESAYEACFCEELRRRGLRHRRQVELPLRYKGVTLEVGYRIDILVEELVLVEVKAVEKLLPVHTAQVLTYLRLANLRVGLLFNFHCPILMSDGFKRLVR